MEEEKNDFDKELESLIIKDKDFRRKKNIKLLLIILAIIIFIAIFIVVLIQILKYKGGKIICVYETLNDNENILLINIKDDIQYELIVDDIKYDKNKYHTFEKSGLHNVIFHFKNKLDNMEAYFILKIN